MRSTNQNLVRKYIYDVRLGDTKAASLCLGGTILWPTYHDTLHTCTLDIAAVEGSLHWAYWLHALDAITNLGSSPDCNIHLSAGGRNYKLLHTFDRFLLAAFDSRATITFGTDGPHADKLRVGDDLVMTLRIPAREKPLLDEVTSGSANAFCSLPWLPRTMLRFTVSKGQKKVNANWTFAVLGASSSRRHITGHSVIQGHQRGDWVTSVWAKNMNVHGSYLQAWNDSYALGDTALNVQIAILGGARVSDVHLCFPSFTQTIRFKVASVTRHA